VSVQPTDRLSETVNDDSGDPQKSECLSISVRRLGSISTRRGCRSFDLLYEIRHHQHRSLGRQYRWHRNGHTKLPQAFSHRSH